MHTDSLLQHIPERLMLTSMEVSQEVATPTEWVVAHIAGGSLA